MPRSAPPACTNRATGDKGGTPPLQSFTHMQMSLQDQHEIVVPEQLQDFLVVGDDPVRLCAECRTFCGCVRDR